MVRAVVQKVYVFYHNECLSHLIKKLSSPLGLLINLKPNIAFRELSPAANFMVIILFNFSVRVLLLIIYWASINDKLIKSKIYNLE